MQEAAATAAEVTAALASLDSSARHLARPSSANSSLATEYYGRPIASVSAARTAEAACAPAADRLYADHFRKQQMLEEQRRIRDLELQLLTQQAHCTPVSRALASHRNAQGYASYGERLYVEGRLDAMRRAQEADRIKAEEEAAELAEATFQPQISAMAQQLKAAAARGSGGAPPVPWDRLYRRGAAAKREVRAEMIRREQDEAAMKECTFRPSIDSHSDRLMKQRRAGAPGAAGLPHHQRLYRDARQRASKIEEAAQRLPDDATFTPRINTSSVVVRDLLAKRPASGSAAARDVADRLLQRGKQYRERLEAAREARAAPLDDSGHQLFHPKTHRAPKFERNLGGKGIGEHLYAAALASSTRAQQHAEEARRRAEAEAASTHVNALSVRMMERLKKERFKAVYAYLGKVAPGEAPPPALDLRGAVSDEHLMDTVDPEVRADVEHAARLLAAHEAEARSSASGADAHSGVVSRGRPGSAGGSAPVGVVDEQGFVALMQEVLARTRGVTRQYLLPLPGSRKKWDDPTFRPAVDRRSAALAARARPENVPLHEVLYRTAAETEQKKELMRMAQEEATLRECSFRPALVAAPMAIEGRALKLAGKPKAVPAPPPLEEEQEVEVAAAPGTELRPKSAGEKRKAAKGGSRGGSAEGPPRPTAAPAPPAPAHVPTIQELEAELDAIAASGAMAVSSTPATYSAMHAASSGRLHAHVGTGAAAAGRATPPGESLEDGIDAIERQIKEAMARLSTTGESFLASLQGAKAGGAKPAAPQPAPVPLSGSAGAMPEEATPAAVPSGPALAARLRASLDYHALFGAGSPAGSADGSEAMLPSEVSSMQAMNPLSGMAVTPVTEYKSAVLARASGGECAYGGDAAEYDVAASTVQLHDGHMVGAGEETSGSSC